MNSLIGTSDPTRVALRHAGQGVVHPLDSGSAGLCMGASGVHSKTLFARSARLARRALLALGIASAGFAIAATPPNTTITNVGRATFTVAGVSFAATGTATLVTTAHTPAVIEFLEVVPNTTNLPAGLASVQPVPVTQCNAGTGFKPLPAPVVPGQGPLQVPGNYLLAPTPLYAAGDVVFVRVVDYDRNVDPLVAETIRVDVAVANGDTESLLLTETGPSTGVFLGYIGTAASGVKSGDCVLDISGNQKLVATYLDESENNTVISAGALVDPLGVVFDTGTGKPVDGAMVTMIDVATGQPARIFGNDGLSTFPATVETGGRVTDSGGAVYQFGPGRYQFPRVAPGTYRFEVATPAGYRFPSTATSAAIQALPGGPFIVVTGSRGDVFQIVPGPALHIDLPVDPGPLGDVVINKAAAKATAAIGDFVPYTLTVSNQGIDAIAGLRISDHLPPGFRYQAGSVRLNDKPVADPTIGADGRTLEFSLGTLKGSAAATIKYVVAVGAGARLGLAENTAQAVGKVRSNIARAAVQVTQELFSQRAILMGRVTLADSCDAEGADAAAKAVALSGVRVLLEDGTYINTDAEGRWHADNIRPGTHVVQLDARSLPANTAVKLCEQNTRSAGRDLSQFVNVRGGTLWRADFRLARVASCVRQELGVQGNAVRLALSAPVVAEEVSATVMLPDGARWVEGSARVDGVAVTPQAGDGFLVFRLGKQTGPWSRELKFDLEAGQPASISALVRLQAADASQQSLKPLTLKAPAAEASQCAPVASQSLSEVAGKAAAAASGQAGRKPNNAPLVEVLPYDDKWLAAAQPGLEWLHPQVGFNPAVPSLKVAVKHDRAHRVELRLNGEPADRLAWDGVTLNPAGTIALSKWRGVHLKDGPNTLAIVVRDADGAVVSEESRVIYYASRPASLTVDPKRSSLEADGVKPPVIAVRMLDQLGQPVRRGVIGSFEVDPPYAAQDQADAVRREPLTGNVGRKAQYEVGEDGVALIALQPTTAAGEVVLRFMFGAGQPTEARAWLTPQLRDWVLVGFGEGTVGHKKLAGNIETLTAAGADDKLFDNNRLAFYAKGKVLGEYVLTAAYDTAKERGVAGSKILKQGINPNTYYTLYADATQAQFDAASASKLYLKIEKTQFYAMFGDFDTGLTVTELGKYSRTLNGFRSEYKGDTFKYSAFAARTSQSYRKNEFQGDGTTGPYRIAARNIVLNSDKVRIEVRDRLRSEIVVSSRVLTPFLDYQLDPTLGTIFFKEPIAARDPSFNPVFVIVEYESDDGGVETTSYGGRAAMKVGEKSEVGLTRVHDGSAAGASTLTAVDASLQLTPSTRLRAEYATASRPAGATATGVVSGHAYVVEATHDAGALAGRVYLREQEGGFGLGQQTAAEGGMRKVGAEARLRLTETLQLQAQASHEENLSTEARRDVVEAKGEWNNKNGLAASVGFRAGNEVVPGTVDKPESQEIHTRQVTASASYELLDKRLTLKGSTELDAGSSRSVIYPNRLLLGADYKLSTETSLFAQEEIARGEKLKSNSLRLGLRTQPWSGAEARASVGQENTLDSGRLFANLGLVQKWKIDDNWRADIGIDRAQTLRGVDANPLSPAAALPSGTPVSTVPLSTTATSPGLQTGSYTALSGGLAYTDKVWSTSARTEWRHSDSDNKFNLVLGAQRNLDEGRAVAAGLSYLATHGTLDASKLDLRLSYAYRPVDSKWIWLDRLEYVHESSQTLESRLFTRKLINNFNANWTPNRRTQVALQYGAKFVRDSIDNAAYKGFTDLMGVEARYDITERWDIGLHAGVLHSWKLHTREYQLGVSVGFKITDNTWLSVGYNQLGFTDTDFAGAEYRAKGLYLNLRVKFDQDTFDLNDRKAAQLPLKQ